MKSTKTAPKPSATAVAIAAKTSDVVDLRVGPPAWPGTQMSATQIIEATVEAIANRHLNVRCEGRIKRGVTRATDALATFPGDTWEQRWLASRCDADPRNHLAILGGALPPADSKARSAEIRVGIDYLMLVDAIRPSYHWLLARPGGNRITAAVLDSRGARGFLDNAEASSISAKAAGEMGIVTTQIMLQTGKNLASITGQDILDNRTAQMEREGKAVTGHAVLWKFLSKHGTLPATPTYAMELARGQLCARELVDQYGLADTPVRQMLIRYLQDRSTGLDYNSLAGLARMLVANFWADIELHHPAVSGLDLRLPKSVADQWLTRLGERGQSSRTLTVIAVRALYLDVGQLAHDDPYWAPFAAPMPFGKNVTKGSKKAEARARARLHQKVRTISPQMPKLLKSVDDQRRWWAALLTAAQPVEHGQTFTFDEVEYEKRSLSANGRKFARDRLLDCRDNSSIDVTVEEGKAFWRWAIVNTLYYTGIRCEELLELTATAITRYRLPGTGEHVPVLQIAPSKTDKERILLVDVELAHTLAEIKRRLADPDTGKVPMIVRYDGHERLHTPPMPFLLQHRVGAIDQAIARATVKNLLNEAIEIAGIRDANGAAVTVSPHDFRRVFITDAVSSQLPVHIVARIVGHNNITTTQVYIAVNDDDTMRHYQTFLNNRRKLRPQEEYRAPSEAELAEYEKHFLKRKVELGSCGRAYGTDCKHEHACIRCSQLRPDPAQRPRLEAIKQNLEERLIEAREKSWLGEIEGIELSLVAAQEKLDRMTNIVALETPSFPTQH